MQRAKTNTVRFLAMLLAILLLSQIAVFQISAFAEEAPALKDEHENVEVYIPAGATKDQMNEILSKALLANYKSVGVCDWEYYTTGTYGISSNVGPKWGSVAGFTWVKTILFTNWTVTAPSLSNQVDGTYDVRLASNPDCLATIKKGPVTSFVEVSEDPVVDLVVNDNAYDTEAMCQEFRGLISNVKPEGIRDDLKITCNYPEKESFTVTYDATAGIKGYTNEFPVTINDGRPEYAVVLNGDENTNYTVNLGINDDLSYNFDNVKSGIFNAVIKSINPELTADDVNISYVADSSCVGKQQSISISYLKDLSYKPLKINVTVTLADPRADIEFNTADENNSYSVAIGFNDDQSVNYEKIAENIFAAVVKNTNTDLSAKDVEISYYAVRGLVFREYDYVPLSGDKRYGPISEGNQKVKLEYAGGKECKAFTKEVTIDLKDMRIPTEIVLKEGASFVYNKDAEIMKQAILDKAIDWENSTLPEGSNINDYTFEYSAACTPAVIDGKISTESFDKNAWAPIEGSDNIRISLVKYTAENMGAGEQTIRVKYKGNAEYKPSDFTEGTVTVEKAPVKVAVHSAIIYAGDPVPEGFVTTDPEDNFDIYTIYAGITSNVTSIIYVQLPDRMVSETVLKILDPIVAEIRKDNKTLSELLNEGMTVGELRDLLKSISEDPIAAKIIDVSGYGQLIEAINNLPGILDDVRVAFGTPSRAGIYEVTAVTSIKNYNTGVGVGALVVKKHLLGTTFDWNKKIEGKLTVDQAADFDFGATLYYDGEPVTKNDYANFHYRYTGWTSNRKLYSSTEAPTAAGKYIETVSVTGGNYSAVPATRTFTIVENTAG